MSLNHSVASSASSSCRCRYSVKVFCIVSVEYRHFCEPHVHVNCFHLMIQNFSPQSNLQVNKHYIPLPFRIKHTISVKFLSLSSVYLVPWFDKSTCAIRCGKSITLCQHLIGIIHQIFISDCLEPWQPNCYNSLIHTFAVLQIKCQYNFYTDVLSM